LPYSDIVFFADARHFVRGTKFPSTASSVETSSTNDENDDVVDERERERGGKSHSMLTPVEVGRAIVIVTVKPVPAPHNPLFQWPLIVIAIA